MKKLIIVIIVIAVVAGAYQLFFNKGEEEFAELDFDIVNFKDFDLYFSSLRQAQIPYIELEEAVVFDVEKVGVDNIKSVTATPSPSVSFDASVFDVSVPVVNIPNMDGASKGTPSPEQWSPNQSDCSRFAAAPSCSYVPEANREMCEACKRAGY